MSNYGPGAKFGPQTHLIQPAKQNIITAEAGPPVLYSTEHNIVV